MSKTRFELLASAAQSATGQGSGISVGGIKNLLLCVDVTSVSGSCTAIYMQGSSDGGTTWFDLLASTACILTSGAGATTTGTYPGRNLVGTNGVVSALSSGNVAKIAATYATFGDYIRAAFVISGSGPAVTFSVKGVGEN